MSLFMTQLHKVWCSEDHLNLNLTIEHPCSSTKHFWWSCSFPSSSSLNIKVFIFITNAVLSFLVWPEDSETNRKLLLLIVSLIWRQPHKSLFCKTMMSDVKKPISLLCVEQVNLKVRGLLRDGTAAP